MLILNYFFFLPLDAAKKGTSTKIRAIAEGKNRFMDESGIGFLLPSLLLHLLMLSRKGLDKSLSPPPLQTTPKLYNNFSYSLSRQCGFFSPIVSNILLYQIIIITRLSLMNRSSLPVSLRKVLRF